jgi:MFS family permease
VRASLTAFRRVFSNRDLRRLQLAWAGSNVGGWSYTVAIAVYAYQQDGAYAVGLIGLARWIAAGAASPFTGALGDRFPRVRVMVTADLLRAVLLATMALVVVADGSPVVVYAISIVGTVIGTAFRPAQAAIVPGLARTPEELTAANVASGFILSASLFAGPGIASLLLAVSGATAVVLVAGAMLLLGSLVAALVPRRDARAPVRVEGVRVLGGFGELARNWPAAWLICLFGAQNIAWGMVDVFIVTLAIDRLGLNASAVGILSAALGVGALLGGAATVALVGRQRLAPGLAFGVLCWSLPLFVIGIEGGRG